MHRRDNWKLTLTMTRTGPGVHWHWPGFLCDPRFLNQKSFYFLAPPSAWTAFDHHPDSKLKLERDLANTRTVP